MNFSMILAIVASLIFLVGHVIYNAEVLRTKKEPDLIPWTIWGLMAAINWLTYRDIAQNSVMSLLVQLNIVAAILTFTVALFIGGKLNIRNITARDLIILGLGILAIILWKLGGSVAGNACVLIGSTLGYEPIWRKLAQNKNAQASLPWLLWTTGLALNVLVVYLNHGSAAAYLQPVVYVLLHGLTLAMTLKQF